MSINNAREMFAAFNDWTDERLTLKLNSIESAIRAYTNNNFQNRAYRNTAEINGGILYLTEKNSFEVGDTIEISYGKAKGLYTVKTASDNTVSVNEKIADTDGISTVTKVEYPSDVIYCAINILEWEVNNRSKVGIQSETLSRHSVTYFNYDNSNIMGYPSSLFGALQPYKKARC
jgi:hypothetical protein